ncbi:MAG: hypothetical protein IJM15_04365 [Erysipelotrichaceae bacterium]|nr:hypothetical protein [Erysipelotrichaceae bacterium]
MRSLLQIIYYILCAVSVLLFGCSIFSFPPQVSKTLLALLGIITTIGNLVILVVISLYKEKRAVMKHAAADQQPVERAAETVMKHAYIESREEESDEEQQEEFQEVETPKLLEIPLVAAFMKRFVYERQRAVPEQLSEPEKQEVKPVFEAKMPEVTPEDEPQEAAVSKPIMSFSIQNDNTVEMTNETQLFYQQTAELQDISNLRQQIQQQQQEERRQEETVQKEEFIQTEPVQPEEHHDLAESVPDPENVQIEKYYEPLSDSQKEYIEKSNESYLNTVGMPQLRITKTLDNDSLRQEVNRRLMLEKQVEEAVEAPKPKLRETLNEDSEEFDLEKYESIDSILNVIITVLIIILFGFGLFLLYRKLFG